MHTALIARRIMIRALCAAILLAGAGCAAYQTNGARGASSPFIELSPFDPAAAGSTDAAVAQFQRVQAELLRLDDFYSEAAATPGRNATAEYLREVKRSFESGKLKGYSYADITIGGRRYRVAPNAPLPSL